MPGSVLVDTARTNRAENAEAEQNSRPKPKACEKCGLSPGATLTEADLAVITAKPGEESFGHRKKAR